MSDASRSPVPPPGEPELIYGLLAEFRDEAELTRAAERVHEAGYRRVDAFTPYPSEEVIHALGLKRSWVPLIVFLGGALGPIAA